MPPKVLDLQESPLNTPQKPLEQKTTTNLLIFILHITWLIVATPLTYFATAKVMAPPATSIARQNPKWLFDPPFLHTCWLFLPYLGRRQLQLIVKAAMETWIAI
jgi:hypothetical protein